VPEALAVCPKPSESLALHWLALVLTPRLGPTRARRLVEHFGGVQNIFKASLTELEATGIQTVSVQSLGTGQSMELAQDELGRVAAAGVTVVCQGDSTYPAQLKQIYDPPLVLYVCGNVDAIAQPGIAVVGTRHPAVFGTRGGHCLSQGEKPAHGSDAVPGWRPDLRISHEHVRRAAKFSHSQSHHQRHFNRRSGGGSRGIHRYQDYVALRFGTESRGFRRPRQRYQ
jgi:hypothetical protein